MSATRMELLHVAARFAWPAAFVAIAAMTFAHLRSRPEAEGHDLRVQTSSTVVRSLRDIARLETTSLHVEKVIDVKDHQERLHGLVQPDSAARARSERANEQVRSQFGKREAAIRTAAQKRA